MPMRAGAGRAARGFALVMGCVCMVAGCTPGEDAPRDGAPTPAPGPVGDERPPVVSGGTPGGEAPTGSISSTPSLPAGGTLPPARTPPASTPPREAPGTPPELGGERGRYLRGTFHAGVGPDGLAVGDFNRDGAPDVAVLTAGRSLESQYRARPGKVAVLLNMGQGHLSQPLLKTELSSASGQLAAGDLDGDGVLDLLAGTRSGAVLLRGRQDGSFKWESSGIGGGVVWSLGIQPGTGTTPTFGWAAGTYDGQEVPHGWAGMSLVRRGADGAFTVSLPTTEQGAPLVRSWEEGLVVTLADFNEDGQADLVMSSDDLPVTVLLGKGSDRFAFQPFLATHARRLASADFDTDGHQDLAVLDEAALRVYRGNGKAGFTEVSVTQPPYPVDALTVVDLDADGLADLAAVHRAASAVTLWYGRGDGGFQPASTVAVGRQPRSIAVADLDADGQRELLVAEAGDNSVSVYGMPPAAVVERLAPRTCPVHVSPGEARVTPAPLATVVTSTHRPYAAAGDFDGNGHRDVALAKEGGGVKLLLNQGTGQFVMRDARTDLRMLGLAAGDFNGDGRDDLAAITLSAELAPYDDGGQETFHLLWGDGQGDFPTSTNYPSLSPFGAGHVVTEDLDRDGDLDLVVSVPGTCVPRTARLVNQGQGVMVARWLPDLNQEPDDRCSPSWAPAIADFNRDGKPDILHHSIELNLDVTSADGGSIAVEGFARNPGHGDFSVGDVDGDGTVDLVTARKGALDLYPGDGRGTLQAPLPCETGAGKAVLEARDVNGDGITDLVGVDAEARRVVLMLGVGGGTFLPMRHYAMEEPPLWVKSMDLLGDARPELVIMASSGLLSVYATPEP
jgi:hypothetical protein